MRGAQLSTHRYVNGFHFCGYLLRPEGTRGHLYIDWKLVGQTDIPLAMPLSLGLGGDREGAAVMDGGLNVGAAGWYDI